MTKKQMPPVPPAGRGVRGPVDHAKLTPDTPTPDTPMKGRRLDESQARAGVANMVQNTRKQNDPTSR